MKSVGSNRHFWWKFVGWSRHAFPNIILKESQHDQTAYFVQLSYFGFSVIKFHVPRILLRP